jgi:ferric-dicitrate binding protein FerR (iron transport regulator)
VASAPSGFSAPARTKNPAGRIYVASVDGVAQITAGDKIEALVLKASYFAHGKAIETKPRGTVAMVFSSGTGIFLDTETQIEVTRFVQDPFVPGRTTMEIEPSVSQTEILLLLGTAAVSTSKLAPGSTFVLSTSLGSIHLRDGKMVAEVTAELSRFTLLAGDATVRGGTLDLSGKLLHAGEQAVVRAGAPGLPNSVEISKIVPVELAGYEEKATTAYLARKTVFFETDATGEILAIPVVPASLPVPATVSPARLTN